MNFSFHPDAEEEFNNAIEYYEALEPQKPQKPGQNYFCTSQLLRFHQVWSSHLTNIRKGGVANERGRHIQAG